MDDLESGTFPRDDAATDSPRVIGEGGGRDGAPVLGGARAGAPIVDTSASAARAGPSALVDVVLRPGVYHEFVHVTAIGDARLLTLSYSSASGWDDRTKSPRFSCTYYVAARLPPGRRENDALAFNYDEPRKASVEILGPTTVRVRMDGGPLYGSMALTPDADVTLPDGATFEREVEDGGGQQAAPFRHATAANAYFHTRPDGPRLLAHIVDGDNVFTLEERSGWVLGRYRDVMTGAAATGWIATTDLAPLP
jgi:hypothetical protein